MDKQTAERVLSHPKFQTMAKQKSILGWTFSAIMFAVYVIYILFIGIDPHTFGTPVSEGSVTTWGIYIGLFVILFSIAITGVYVYVANGKFEQATQEVVREVMGVEK
ncbi:membrane protein [Neisseria arctica]|uniref:Membrane protein n=1 Tax=Neisseria arctica TaxID=1470200 RepID=A0A0J0YUB3_9NEIS|nr:DUF485 domain-containing protein [Neisseria arctica]KLT73689.1 membrane protein [Neisseria arctica]UOO85824.1 DUF485 domain-containing protein [Neisseria arctica]